MDASRWNIIDVYRHHLESNLPAPSDDEAELEQKSRSRVFAQAMISLLEQIRDRPEFADVRLGRSVYMLMLQPAANHEKIVTITAIDRGTAYTMWIKDINYQEFPETRVNFPADEAIDRLEAYIRQLREEATGA